MNDQVAQNMKLVHSMMATTQNAQDLQQGSKKLIPVHVDYAAESGTHYTGTLFFRRPSAMDYIRMGAIKSELLRSFGIRPVIEYVPVPVEMNPEGGFERVESMAHIDTMVIYLARSIATFDVILVNPPVWFAAYRESEDTDLLIYVYHEYDIALRSFRDGAPGVPSSDSETGNDKADVAHP